MKRLLWISAFLVIVVIIIFAFSKKNINGTKTPLRFCTILPSKVLYHKKTDTIPFVGSPSSVWDSRSAVRVYFYDGSLAAQTHVLELANIWSSLAKISFEQVYVPTKADIRISFRNCDGYNSLVGKHAWDPEYKNKPTMCLQGLDKSADSALFTNTVLHEFGHVMGMLHELQNPNAVIPWDTLKLYQYYDSVYGWSTAWVDEYVLKQFKDSVHSKFDSFSIMLYSVPAEVVKGNFHIDWPMKLSTLDKVFIKTYYH